MEFIDLCVRIASAVGIFLIFLAPYLVWCGFWLWAVNWKKAWTVLGQGGWAPLVLLMLTIALAWSKIAPGPCACLGSLTIPNFWWQFGEVLFLTGLALFCGWLQGYFHLTPPDVEVEPPPLVYDHGHGHGGSAH